MPTLERNKVQSAIFILTTSESIIAMFILEKGVTWLHPSNINRLLKHVGALFLWYDPFGANLVGNKVVIAHGCAFCSKYVDLKAT